MCSAALYVLDAPLHTVHPYIQPPAFSNFRVARPIAVVIATTEYGVPKVFLFSQDALTDRLVSTSHSATGGHYISPCMM